jgi:hypothetical protein
VDRSRYLNNLLRYRIKHFYQGAVGRECSQRLTFWAMPTFMQCHDLVIVGLSEYCTIAYIVTPVG